MKFSLLSIAACALNIAVAHSSDLPDPQETLKTMDTDLPKRSLREIFFKSYTTVSIRIVISVVTTTKTRRKTTTAVQWIDRPTPIYQDKPVFISVTVPLPAQTITAPVAVPPSTETVTLTLPAQTITRIRKQKITGAAYTVTSAVALPASTVYVTTTKESMGLPAPTVTVSTTVTIFTVRTYLHLLDVSFEYSY